MDAHTGTHVDARSTLSRVKTLDQIPWNSSFAKLKLLTYLPFKM